MLPKNYEMAKPGKDPKEYNFPPGNQFWKLRSKHGRDKIFATPEIMLQAAYEYFDWCEKHPLIEIDFRGSNPPVQVKLPKMRAMTMWGLCSFLHVNTVYFNQFENTLKEKPYELNLDFTKVIGHIRECITTQKFEGAAAGFLNANIIARDLGLKDQSGIDHSGIPSTLNIIVDKSETADTLNKLRNGGKTD